MLQWITNTFSRDAGISGTALSHPHGHGDYIQEIVEVSDPSGAIEKFLNLVPDNIFALVEGNSLG